MFGFGSNRYGQLASGGFDYSCAPRRLQAAAGGAAPFAGGVRQIAAGAEHRFAPGLRGVYT